MIKKIQEVLSFRRKRVRDHRPEFNAELLDRYRDDVFVLMHQQIRGMN